MHVYVMLMYRSIVVGDQRLRDGSFMLGFVMSCNVEASQASCDASPNLVTLDAMNSICHYIAASDCIATS